LTLEEQLAYFDRKAEQAYARTLRAYKDRREAILCEARRRMVDSHPLYGDRSWGKSYEALHQDELEEMADSVNYRLMKMHQGWQ
jgi:hypothetical protein